MYKTKHMHQRMSQRGIKQCMVDLALSFGELQGDKTILNKKEIDCLLKEMENIKKVALKVRDKGGLVVVEANASVITTYSLNSYKR